MELRINLSVAATGFLLTAAVALTTLVLAGVVPVKYGLSVGNALLIVAGVVFMTSRLERFASMAFRRGHEVGMEDAVRSIANRR